VGDEIVFKLGNMEYDWYAPFNYISHIKKARGLASTLLIKTEEEGGQFQSALVRA